jgi:hypothetical protein
MFTDNSLGKDLSINLETMNQLRLTTDIKEVSAHMKELWVWYGLSLMVNVCRKEWLWHKCETRKTRLMGECVVVGDEALALQIIWMRGESYFSLKLKQECGEDIRSRRGRKTFVKGDISTQALTERIDLYVKMRGDVTKIRKTTPNDELGWDRYLREVELKQMEGCTSETGADGRRKAEIVFDTYDFENDETIE